MTLGVEFCSYWRQVAEKKQHESFNRPQKGVSSRSDSAGWESPLDKQVGKSGINCFASVLQRHYLTQNKLQPRKLTWPILLTVGWSAPGNPCFFWFSIKPLQVIQQHMITAAYYGIKCSLPTTSIRQTPSPHKAAIPNTGALQDCRAVTEHGSSSQGELIQHLHRCFLNLPPKCWWIYK